MGDRDGVLKAKTEIFKYLQKDGHIVLNGDDDKLCTVKEYEGIKPVFFGMEADKDVYADEITSRGLKGMTCRIHVGGEVLYGRYSDAWTSIWYTMPWLLLQLAVFMG